MGKGIEVPKPAAKPEAVRPVESNPIFNPNELKIAENDQIRRTPIWLIVLMGFAGGVILNIMPCVLPVIGLKIISFIEQSGHNRRHALMLNVWYSLGLLSVFLVLATLAVTLGLGWGQLFSYNGFNIAMAAVVFVMGLSFLGVWEIPIPGFVGRGKAVEIAEKEGAGGAFAKGVLTTILATPCSAPVLAPALTWAVTQPPHLTYAVFVAVGLGMASPYLLIGAFPNLIAFLPKPGAWMDTFKQIMGFVLLGTVIFVLTFIPWPLVVPTVGFLFGLWAACWWVGRLSPLAEAGEKYRAWLAALALGGVAWLMMFTWLAGIMQERFNFALEAACAPGDRPGRFARRTLIVAAFHPRGVRPGTRPRRHGHGRLHRRLVPDLQDAGGHGAQYPCGCRIGATEPHRHPEGRLDSRRSGGHADAETAGQQAGARAGDLSGRQSERADCAARRLHAANPARRPEQSRPVAGEVTLGLKLEER